MTDLSDTLTKIAQHAAELRRARVQSVTVDGVSFVLLPDEPDVVEVRQTPEPELSALDDPKTYGWPEGSKPPGFVDPRKSRQ